MGPQHPSTHGVLRLVLDLEGETVTKARVVIGYLHTGIEKNTEYRTWTQGTTFVTRMDYLSPLFNETAYCLAVEKLLGIEAPPRAQTIRVLVMELNRIASHLVGLATFGMEIGALTGDDQRLPRARAGPRPARGDHRPADEPRLRPPRRPGAGPARGRGRARSASSCSHARADHRDAPAAHRPADLAARGSRTSASSTSPAASPSASPGRSCASAGLPWDLRKVEPYCGYETYDFEVPTADTADAWGRYLVRVAEMRRVAEDRRAGAGQARARPGDGRGQARSPGRRSSRSAPTAWATRSTT